ncbi:MAG TPA: tetratricopeptide repeat protein [Verrucomicrobiota bacterium]|nr:tetratricopeptide repeat protein [Verrucomicrobiota bacterium]
MKPLEPPDSLHLDAAQGWLTLGDTVEANEELEKIAVAHRAHPDVLEVRWAVLAAAKKWEACVEVATLLTEVAPDRPEGWVHRAYALHELRRTLEAWETLQPVMARFPDAYLIPYNLACYAAQLGSLEAARALLEKACAVSRHPEVVRQMAREDKDLEPLRG